MKHLKKVIFVSTCALLLAACSKKNAEVPKQTTTNLPALLELAAKGDMNAQFELGALYHDGQGGVQKDFVKAKEYFEKAATQGEVRSEFNLGVMYYIGEGVKQDYKKAITLFESAAKKGNSRAQFNLGVMYYRAEGIQQDYKKAMEYFTAAAVQGFHEAQFNIGVMHAKGEGVPVNIAQAYAWFVAARDNGNPNAAEPIGNIERELKPEDLKTVQALAKQLKDELAAKAKEIAVAQAAAEKAGAMMKK